MNYWNALKLLVIKRGTVDDPGHARMGSKHAKLEHAEAGSQMKSSLCQILLEKTMDDFRMADAFESQSGDRFGEPGGGTEHAGGIGRDIFRDEAVQGGLDAARIMNAGVRDELGKN
jgi:hypothetical protein